MVKLFIARFWPLWVLVILAILWWVFVVRIRRKKGILLHIRPWEKKAWAIAFGSTFIVLVILLLVEVIREPAHRPTEPEHYVAPTMHEGKIIPGHMEH